tara:strand:- start:126 stop:797 length:672 start_codon:yes stop_codon:yes gene_type:complete
MSLNVINSFTKFAGGGGQIDIPITAENWNLQVNSSIVSEQLKVWSGTAPPYSQATHTLDNDIDGDFVLRYRLKWIAGDSYIFVGLYSELPADTSDTTMDFCEGGFYFQPNSNRGMRAYAGANTSYGVDPVASEGASQDGVADTYYYIELSRDYDANTLTLNKYTASDYTGTPQTTTMSSTPSGISGLKYLKVVYTHDGSTGGTSSYILTDQFQIQPNVSTWGG